MLKYYETILQNILCVGASYTHRFVEENLLGDG